MNAATLKQQIDQKPMNAFQWSVVAICICLNIIDGFDVLVMAFTASAVAKEWGLSGSEIGLLLSSGLFGMAAGSLTLAPQADKFGRKPVILLSLVVVSVGMILSSFSTSALELGILRFITGLGIGGILASSNDVNQRILICQMAQPDHQPAISGLRNRRNRRWFGVDVSNQNLRLAIGFPVRRPAFYRLHFCGVAAPARIIGISAVAKAQSRISQSAKTHCQAQFAAP